jgi:signal recognition particle GTPase
MIEVMAKAPSWSLRQWKAMLEDQLGSWMRYIPGMSSSAEVVQVKKFKAILDALTDRELDDVSLVNGIVRERVAVAAAQPVEDVAKMILFYKQTLILYSWLRIKQQNKESLPATEEELVTMQEADTRIQELVKKIAGKNRKTGRGRGLPV